MGREGVRREGMGSGNRLGPHNGSTLSGRLSGGSKAGLLWKIWVGLGFSEEEGGGVELS